VRALSYGRVVDAATRDGELRVFVVAGEVSGDSLASRLMASLRALSPVPVRFAGVGGYVFSLVRLLVQYLVPSKI
jgi:lipid-A-disaccharide synthase